MTHRLNLVLLTLILAIGLPYYWFLLDNSGGSLPAKPVTMAQLRQLAASIPGEAPYAVEMERSAFRRVPGNTMVAGSGMKRKLVGYMAFRLPVRGGRPVMTLTSSASCCAAGLRGRRGPRLLMVAARHWRKRMATSARPSARSMPSITAPTAAE